MDAISYLPALWLVLLIPLAVVYARSLVERRKLLKVSSFILRCLGLVLLAAALCRPFFSSKTDDVHVVFLVDVSESIDSTSALQAVDEIRRHGEELRPGDSSGMFAFASQIRQTDPNALTEQLTGWARGVSDDVFRRQTRIADALMAARLSFPAGKAKRIVLCSDGRETAGDFAAAIRVLTAEGVDVKVRPLAGVNYPEASVVSLQAGTPTAYYGERVRLTAVLSSNRAMAGTLRILNRGAIEAEAPVVLEARNDNRVSIDVAMTTSGNSTWTAELAAEQDHFPVNNRASCTINVIGKAKVLVLHEKPARMRQFKRALAGQQIEVDVRGRHGLGQTVSDLLDFDAIVIANFPATAMTDRQLMNLKSYVSDFAGGLIMLGSENSFGLGGYYRTPVEEVLPLVSRYEKEKERSSLAMVLVIDKSGSMQGLPVALARQAAKASAELLSARDQIAIVAFDGRPYVIVDMTFASDVQAVCSAVDSIVADGGTNMFPAMETARDLLVEASAKIKHMIILSDGMSIPGDFESLAGEMADLKITVSTVALGNSADRALMKAIAEIGQGRYYQTLDPETVPRIFTKETTEASRSAIREEPFLPIQIGQTDLLEGIDMTEMPFLLGYVMSRPKPTAKMLLLTESGDPLLATGRFGLGVTMAFTSDASDRWAGEWMQWPQFGKFWAQLIRACVRKGDSRGLDVQRFDDVDSIRLLIRAKDDSGIGVNQLDLRGVLVDEQGRREDVPIRQTGIGMYEAKIKRPPVGRYVLRVQDEVRGKTKLVYHHEDYPREYRLDSTVAEGFDSLGKLSGGKVFEGLPLASTKRSLQNFALIAGILCILAGILLRRL